jgi:hypothetical protein
VVPSAQPGIWLVGAKGFPVADSLDAAAVGLADIYGVDVIRGSEAKDCLAVWRGVWVWSDDLTDCDFCGNPVPDDLKETSDNGDVCCSEDCALTLSTPMHRAATMAGV